MPRGQVGECLARCSRFAGLEFRVKRLLRRRGGVLVRESQYSQLSNQFPRAYLGIVTVKIRGPKLNVPSVLRK